MATPPTYGGSTFNRVLGVDKEVGEGGRYVGYKTGGGYTSKGDRGIVYKVLPRHLQQFQGGVTYVMLYMGLMSWAYHQRVGVMMSLLHQLTNNVYHHSHIMYSITNTPSHIVHIHSHIASYPGHTH